MGRLTARKVETAKPGVHMDGEGLRLIVGATGTKKWVFRFMRRGRSQEMGLGGSDVSLAMARERAATARRVLTAGEPDRRGAPRQGGASDVRAGCGRIPGCQGIRMAQ